ncbi:MAG: hypothetical protein IPM56_14000 [Ignavibacteriales bacterium]|nr:MAG: hypothetical protein IPM56_14000 [Ignavibacteriales bacterium]
MLSPLQQKLLTSYKSDMISFLRSHPELFNEAVELSVSDNQPFAWRAAQLLWSCMDEDDSRIRKYIPEIVSSIKSKNDGHQMQLLKILFMMKLSGKDEVKVFDVCINVWEDINKIPSVRFNALKFIIKIAKKHPDLLREVSALTQDHYINTLSHGAKNSVMKMIKGLNLN